MSPPRIKSFRLAAVCTLLSLLGVGVTSFANAEAYSLRILGNLGGTDGSVANGINDLGQVVGESYSPGNSVLQAVLWNGTTPTVLDGLGGDTWAYGINNSGQVVGAGSALGSTATQATLWDGTTTPILLSSGPDIYTYATGINASGQIVGEGTYFGHGQAILWNGTTPTFLGGFLNGDSASTNAIAINDSGQAAGITSNDLINQATLWNGTVPTYLNGLDGTISTAALGINNAGQVVGYDYTSASTEAIVWNGITPTDLGVGVALDISDSGLVVGQNQGGAALWALQNGVYVSTDLNTLINPHLGITLQSATAINNLGQIVGDAINDSGLSEAFLLTPLKDGHGHGDCNGVGNPNCTGSVPEPATLSLLGLGLAGLGFMKRKQKAI